MAESIKKLVVFDLDDTLFKEREYESSGFRYVAGELAQRYNVTESSLIDIMFADGIMHPFDRLYDYLDKAVSIDEMIHLYRNHFPKLTLPPDTIKCLNRLKQEAILLGIITDGRHVAQWSKIESLGLTEYIDSSNIIVSEDVGGDKTTLTPWHRMCSLTTGVEERWYVGDNIMKDFVMPNKLGWTTVMLADDGNNVHSQNVIVTDEYRPHYTIESLDRLPGLVIGR